MPTCPASPQAPCPASPAPIEPRRAALQGGSYNVEGVLHSSASPDAVYDLLVDYDALPDVFRSVQRTEMLRAPGHPELLGSGDDLHMVQHVQWAFLVFSGTFATSLAVREAATQRQLSFQLLDSAFLREFVGHWDVQEAGGESGRSVIRHRLTVRGAPGGGCGRGAAPARALLRLHS